MRRIRKRSGFEGSKNDSEKTEKKCFRKRYYRE